MLIGYSLIGLVQKYFDDSKLIKAGIAGTLIALAIVQLVQYKNEYFVPDVAAAESEIALVARKYLAKDEILYMTNYYYPTTVYYSNRQTYAVYSEHDNNGWWVLNKSTWPEILEQDAVVIITTEDERGKLSDYFNKHTFDILHQAGDKLLIRKINNEKEY